MSKSKTNVSMGMVYLQLECCSGEGNMKFVKNVIILNTQGTTKSTPSFFWERITLNSFFWDKNST